MIVSINQPAYLPWLGYFDRIRRSDLHIVLDHVQFEKGSYTNRCRIRQRDGREMWLTVPVEKGRPINETRIVTDGWQRKHLCALEQHYGWRPDFLLHPWDKLEHLLHWAADECWLGGDVETVNSSSLDPRGVKSDLVLNLCREVGATRYLSGPQGRNYLDIPAFKKAGIEVLYHDFPSDGDWGLSAVHHLFGPTELKWPQASLTLAHCSQERARVDPPDPLRAAA